MSKYYTMCKNNIGRHARITTSDGNRYTGIISRVTKQSVYLNRPGVGIAGTKEGSRSATIKAKAAVDTTRKNKGQEILFPGIVPLAAITGLTFVGASPFYGGYGYGPYGYGRFGRPYGPYGYGGFGPGYGPYAYRRRFFW